MPIKHCKICFKLLKSDSLYEIYNDDSCVCEQCQNKLAPHFQKFRIGGVDGVAIYRYDDNIKSLLYQLKGCCDIELSPIFFNRFKNELKTMYKGYVVVPAPSYVVEDSNREFNHVIEIFKFLNLPIYHIVNKITPFKQAEHSKRRRVEIIDHLQVTSLSEINNKKVLIVDDVMTTGSTLKAMISLLSKGRPKIMKILVMAKRELK